MKQLHKTLKEKRELEGYSQEYVAGKLNVSSSTISRWETGAVSMTTSQTYSYAKVLGWDELDLLASIAQRQQARPLPLAQMSIEVFDKESYDRIIDLVKELGPQHIILQYSVNFYAASASKLNISLILSLFNVVFGFFSNTSIIRCT